MGRSRTHTPRIPTCAQAFRDSHARTPRAHTHPQRREKAFLHDTPLLLIAPNYRPGIMPDHRSAEPTDQQPRDRRPTPAVRPRGSCACSPAQTEGYGSEKRHASVWRGRAWQGPITRASNKGWIEGGEIGSGEANGGGRGRATARSNGICAQSTRLHALLPPVSCRTVEKYGHPT